jgi:hypothetical protein
MMLQIKRFRVGGSAMSYIGPLDLPLEFGQYRLDGFNAYISNNLIGPILTAQSRLFRERLWVDGLFMNQDMTREKAQELFGMVRERLCSSPIES